MFASFKWLEIVRQKDAEIARLRRELAASASPPDMPKVERRKITREPGDSDKKFRNDVITARFASVLAHAEGQGPSLFENTDGSVRAVINLSKRHDDIGKGHYWFGLYDSAVEFIGKANIAYVILACKDAGDFFVISLKLIRKHLTGIGRTDDGSSPHYNFVLDDNLDWSLDVGGKRIPIGSFRDPV